VDRQKLAISGPRRSQICDLGHIRYSIFGFLGSKAIRSSSTCRRMSLSFFFLVWLCSRAVLSVKVYGNVVVTLSLLQAATCTLCGDNNGECCCRSSARVMVMGWVQEQTNQ
jgi:hypothetical protein